MSRINLIRMNSTEYHSLSEIDRNAIYFLSDGSIYVDGNPYGGNGSSANIVFLDSIYDFPIFGNENYLYVDKQGDETYRWDQENRKYVCIGSSWREIELIIADFE